MPLLLLLLPLLVPVVEVLPPPFFWAEGWLIASKRSTVVPEHWELRKLDGKQESGQQLAVDEKAQAGTV